MGEEGAIRSRRGLMLLAVLVLLTAGMFGSWQFSAAMYREDLLQAIRIARAGNNPKRVKALTATKADYANPDYQWLKRELVQAKEAVPKCRWLYIMRMGEDGRIFSLCDSDPDFPVDHTLPGFIYEDTSGGFTEILLHGVEKVWGPYTDAFGTWVTAAVPILDDESGDIVGVLGMDVAYRDWLVGVLRRALAPLAFTILITLLVVVLLIEVELRRQRNLRAAEAEAVRIRLKRLQALATASVSRAMASGDVPAFAREISELAARAMGVERVGVWLFDAPRVTLVNVDTYLLSRDAHESGETMDGEAFRREWEVLETDRYFSALDATTDPRTEGYQAYLSAHGIVSMLDAAVRVRGELWGAVCFEHTGARREWTEGEISFVCQVADQVALALANQWEREERERQALLTSAMEQAEEAIMITDAAARILYVNAAFERMTGYGREEVEGKTPAVLKSGRQDADYYRRMWETLLRGGAWTDRLTNRKKSGELYTVKETIAPVRDASGRITHFVSTARDITAALKAAEREEEARKMEVVGRLAGGVAHDFNNMLNVILGHADMALEDMEEEYPAREYVEEIHRAALRAAALTRQLLDFARRRPVRPRPLDLREAVPGMLDMLARLVGEDIALRWEPRAEDLTVMLDPSHLDQVLVNLVVNARDAIGGRPGHVTIRAGRVVACPESGEIAGEKEACREYVVLAVIDDGRGMTDAVRQRIFEPFFTTKEVGHGTGLGLATVHSIVQGAGGHIEVDSAPGCGAAFLLCFPALARGVEGDASREGQQVAPRTEAGRAPVAGSGMTALVVEDEEAILRLARVVLEREGFRVWTASHPKDALALLEMIDTGLDLLLTDVIMPEMNGRELADAVIARCPGVKCLFMSGYTDEIIGRHGVLEAGVHFVQKPFTTRTLREAIEQALGGP
ncbi:MAG: PAS domain S-box protein [Candidatus Hydrogenedentes bacterium]|nr:PAS domain S-box protein [Candidatus Hydrogenedentota bacterium]